MHQAVETAHIPTKSLVTIKYSSLNMTPYWGFVYIETNPLVNLRTNCLVMFHNNLNSSDHILTCFLANKAHLYHGTLTLLDY